MNHTVLVSMIDQVRVYRADADLVRIESPANLQRPLITFKQVTENLLEALEQIRSGASIPFLVGKVMQTDGMAGVGKLMYYVQKLGQHALLNYSLRVRDIPFVCLEPLTLYFRYAEGKVKKGTPYVLSKFAYCHNNRGEMLLHSPLSYGKLGLLHPAALTALHHLLQPRTPEGLAEVVPELDADSASVFMNFLANTGALQESNTENRTIEDDDPALAQWAFHDLLFHANNRMGRHADPYGGTFPFKDKFPALPVVKEAMSDEIIPLFKPDMEQLEQNDIPFSLVLETRRTVREYGTPPIHVDQLGEFLYRSSRIHWIREEAGVSWRPSPGGGALHELEIYPVVNQCEGLSFGLYHYNPLEHHLCRITTAPEPLLYTLLTWGKITGRLDQLPQVLFVITARFQRVQMKYQSVTYSVILKDVGCLYQTMYLVAAAMGLAPCALGGGDSDLFAKAAGLDYYAETSVGEFLLGSAPAVRTEPYARPKGVE